MSTKRTTQKPIVTLDILSTLAGHEKEVITIDDTDPKRRAALSKKVTEMIRDGYHIRLEDGTLVHGYDPKSNEWLVAAPATSRKKKSKNIWDRVKAVGKVATAFAPIAGG